jgi:hypothetical protein
VSILGRCSTTADRSGSRSGEPRWMTRSRPGCGGMSHAPSTRAGRSRPEGVLERHRDHQYTKRPGAAALDPQVEPRLDCAGRGGSRRWPTGDADRRTRRRRRGWRCAVCRISQSPRFRTAGAVGSIASVSWVPPHPIRTFEQSGAEAAQIRQGGWLWVQRPAAHSRAVSHTKMCLSWATDCAGQSARVDARYACRPAARRNPERVAGPVGLLLLR